MCHLRCATQLVWYRQYMFLTFFAANDVVFYVYNHYWSVKKNQKDPKHTFDFP